MWANFLGSTGLVLLGEWLAHNQTDALWMELVSFVGVHSPDSRSGPFHRCNGLPKFLRMPVHPVPPSDEGLPAAVTAQDSCIPAERPV